MAERRGMTNEFYDPTFVGVIAHLVCFVTEV